MPPKRASRASSAAPSDDGTNNNNETTSAKTSQPTNNANTPARPTTRASRRLRSSQEPDASPLKALSPPRRKRAAASTSESSRKPSTSSSSTSTQAQAHEAQVPMAQAQSSTHQQAQGQETTHPSSTYTLPQFAPSSSQVVVSTTDTATAPGTTEELELAHVPSWKRVQYEFEGQIFESHALTMVRSMSERQHRHVRVNAFLRPVLYPHVAQILAFETEANKYDNYEITHKATLHAVLNKLASMMTDEEKVQLMIAQRAKVVEQNDMIQRREAEIELHKKNTQKAEDKMKELQKRYNVSEKLRHKQDEQTKATKKRSAAQFDNEDEEDVEEERPAKRVQVSQSTPAHKTPAKSTPAQKTPAKSTPATSKSAASTSKSATTTPSSAPKASPKVQSSPQSSSKKSDTSPSDFKMARMIVAADRMPTIGEAPSDEEDPNFVMPKPKRPQPELPKDPIVVQYMRHCKEREKERARELKREKWLASGMTEEWASQARLDVHMSQSLIAQQEESEEEVEHEEDEENGADVAMDANADARAQNHDETDDDNIDQDNTEGAVAVLEDDSANEEQAEQTTPQQQQAQAVAPTPSRWFGGIFGKMTNFFTSGGTNGAAPAAVPQTEPVRRVVNRLDAPVNAQTTPTPADKKRRVSAEASRPAAPQANDEEEPEHDAPETPSHNIGITTKDFVPQTAPQPRRNARESRNASKEPWSRKHWYERRDAIEAASKKKKEEEEERRWEAQQKEDERLRAEAKMLRKQWDAEHKTGQKRKVRVDDLEVIPRPAPGVYGMNDKYFEEDSDGEVYVDEDEAAKDHVTPRPTKRVKFDTPETSGSTQRRRAWETTGLGEVSPHAKTPVFTPSADPHRAQPYTGTMFADPKPDEQFSGDNLFGQSANRGSKKTELDLRSDPVAYGKKYGVWTGPSTPKPKGANREGCFYVPESDSDTESEDENEESVITQKAPPKTPEKTSEGNTDRVNVFFQKASADTADNAGRELQAPPSPTMSHATLPGLKTPSAIDQQDSAALAKARSEAEKYKPKTPSGLRATSRLASSPATADNTPTKTGPIPPPKGADSALPWNGFMTDQFKTLQASTVSTNKVVDAEQEQPKTNPFSSLLQQPTAQKPASVPAANPFDLTSKQQAAAETTTTATATTETPGRSLFDRITFPDKATPPAADAQQTQAKPNPFSFPATQTHATESSEPKNAFGFTQSQLNAGKPASTPATSAFQAPKFGSVAQSTPATATSLFQAPKSGSVAPPTSAMATFRDLLPTLKNNTSTTTSSPKITTFRDAFVNAPVKKDTSTTTPGFQVPKFGSQANNTAAAPAIQAPKFGAAPAAGSNSFFSSFAAKAKTDTEKMLKEAKAKRKAEEFDSDEDDEAEWERKDAEREAKKAADLAASSSFKIPTFSAPATGGSSNFMSAFAASAQKESEKAKAKRKAEDFDSDEDDEAEWERKDAEEQAKKKAKLDDGAKMVMKHVEGVGFTLVPADDATSTSTTTTTGHDDAIARANAIPVDELPAYNFTWPVAQKPVLDPAVEAAVDAFVNGPEWEKFKQDTYGGFFENIIKKKSASSVNNTN